MKHHLKRQLRRLSSDRPYQVIVTSAAALVLAATTGVLVAHGDDTPAPRQTSAAAAEVAPRLDGVASRSQLRVAPTPSPSASRASASPSSAATKAAADPDLTPKAAPKPPASKILDYDYQAQINFYYCGPAAVRNALSAADIERTQDAVAGPLGTDQMGTDSAQDTTRVLNAIVKGDPYRTRMIPGRSATEAQMDQLQADVVRAITDRRGVVVNIAGSATDTEGGWHSFPGGHYIAVVGYKDSGRLVKIADSANPAISSYWMTTIDLANWAATRGYSA